MSENIENTDGADRARRGRLLVVALLAIAVIAVVVFGVIRLNAGEGPPGTAPTSTADPSGQPTQTPGGADAQGDAGVDGSIKGLSDVIPEPMSGQEAIDALGHDIDAVAKRNGKSVEELKELLLRDSTVHISTDGFIFYKDDARG